MERGIFRSSQRHHEPHNVKNVEAVFSLASTSAARYVSDSSADNTKRLDESLSDVVRYISDAERAARLTLKNRHIYELLSYTTVILNANTTNASTRSKFYRLLFSIALHNIPIRRFMACELELCGSVFNCLKMSLREQLGPQNMIDILRLLQVMSYEKTVTLSLWTNELISFLIGEVCREPEQEWMPYCIAILCNLATRSKSVCHRIKKSTSYKPFSRRIMSLLQHNARIIVVSCLVLIGYLEEKVRDMVYCTQNVHETFQCVFNVLVIGDDDCLMTRQIAADLLRRLIVSDTPSVSSVPTLATTGKDVLNYGFFNNCIQQTAELLVTLDPRMEESMKIYDLLLSFCSLQILRSPVCQSIVRCKPTESRLTTPILAIAETASMPFETAINGEVPLKALKLLAYLFREIVEPHEKVIPFVPLSQIIQLVNTCIQTQFELNSEDVDLQCRRVQLGLRLAEVCARDEDIRQDLINICTAQTCHDIANYQFLQNPVVMYLTKPPLQRSETLEAWSMSGIGIVLELCRFLAVLKDHSKAHKDQYWQLLKDERLIPFLAYAISFGDHEMVLYAFITYSHCAQVHAFPTHLLAEMVASCTLERRQVQKNEGKFALNTSQEAKMSNGDRPGSAEQDERSVKALDELLRKVSIEGCSLKDAKTSDLFAAFERKISLLQARERDLEALVKAKDEALVQSEKLRLQYRGGVGAGGASHFVSDVELSNMRLVMQECEDLRDQNVKITAILENCKQEFDQKMVEARDDLMRSSQECERLKIEVKDNQKLINSFSLSCEDLKKKLELASANLFENQKKIANLDQEKAHLASELQCLRLEGDRLRQNHESEILKMNAEIAQQVTRIEIFINENKDLKRMFEEKLLECETLKDQFCQSENRCILKEKELGRAHAQISNSEQRLAAKEREISTVLKEVSQYEERLSIKERECVTFSNENQDLRKELDRLKIEVEQLERLREAMLSLASNQQRRNL